jgi:hypothetical protein
LIAALVILLPTCLAISWFDDQIGISSMIIHSWQFLSGVSEGGEVIGSSSHCSDVDVNVLLGIVIWLLTFALLFISVMASFAGVVGMPIGIVCAVFGAGRTLVTRQRESLRRGLFILIVPTGCIILAGILFRISHLLNSAVTGC